MNPILHELQNKQWIWSAANARQQEQQTISTGFAQLDKALSLGFPEAGMIHVNSCFGCGELRLLLKLMQQQKTDDRYWVIISVPGMISAEFLLNQNVDLNRLLIIENIDDEDALWSAEQCARSSACRGVMLWQSNIKHAQIRKLELAAQQGKSYCIWFDNSRQARSNLPLTLSISLIRDDEDLKLTINKQKHGWANQQPIKLPLPFDCRRRFRTTVRQKQKLATVVNLRSQ